MFPKSLWDVVRPLLADLDTPRSLTVKLLIEHGEFDQLVSLQADPAHYCNADKYFRDVVATDLLRKCADLETSIDRYQVAVDGFHAAERQCAQTNVRLAPLLDFPSGPLDGLEWRARDFAMRVKKRVSGLLRSLPRDLQARFGPGATLEDRGVLTTVPHKMCSTPTITPAATGLLDLWRETAWARALMSELPDRSEPKRVRGNRFTTVPKDATKDRGIAIEPSLNVFYQLGVGRELRLRLKQIGIDLDEGQSLHRQLACEASRSTKGHLATIDLSSASDTVCTKLVELIMPEHWHDLLVSLRSPTTTVDGRTHHLQKFSSMGNGYTFELETLIFFSICAQVLEDMGIDALPGVNISVYGDDIIVPSECAAECLAYLSYFGFTANRRKTFVTGVFRESCGGDYFDGVSVRAHYIKKFPTEPQEWIALANGLRRLGEQSGHPDHRKLIRRAWFCALDQLPVQIRNLRGPVDLGDVVIHDTEDRWRVKIRHSIRYVYGYVPFADPLPLTRFSPMVQLASALYGVSSRGPNQRGVITGYRIKKMPFS